MEAFFTASKSRPKGLRRSTARASLGRRCERAALAYCRRRGWRVFARNVRVPGGEIDILARAGDGALILVEVRGRRDGRRLPSRHLSAAKLARLRRLAEALARRHRRVVRIELVEVIGAPPRGRLAYWALAFVPEWLGLTVRGFSC